VPCPCAASRHQQDLVFVLGGDEHIQNGQQGFRPAIHDALPPDLDDVDVGVHSEIFFRFRALEKFLADERFPHQVRLDMQPAFRSLFLINLGISVSFQVSRLRRCIVKNIKRCQAFRGFSLQTQTAIPALCRFA